MMILATFETKNADEIDFEMSDYGSYFLTQNDQSVEFTAKEIPAMIEALEKAMGHL